VVGVVEGAAYGWGRAPCLNSPGGGLAPGCECFDFDSDGDVDLHDSAALQVLMDP